MLITHRVHAKQIYLVAHDKGQLSGFQGSTISAAADPQHSEGC